LLQRVGSKDAADGEDQDQTHNNLVRNRCALHKEQNALPGDCKTYVVMWRWEVVLPALEREGEGSRGWSAVLFGMAKSRDKARVTQSRSYTRRPKWNHWCWWILASLFLLLCTTEATNRGFLNSCLTVCRSTRYAHLISIIDKVVVAVALSSKSKYSNCFMDDSFEAECGRTTRCWKVLDSPHIVGMDWRTLITGF